MALSYDVLRRYPDAGLLWSNDGVLSNHYLLFSPQESPQLSLFFAFSSASEVRLAFLLTLGVFLMYTLGLYTRVVQIASFVLYTSLDLRNLFFSDGGTATTILLAAWTAFLPLGDRYSLDALRRDAGARTIRSRIALRRARCEPVYSLAVLALLLQAFVIYWFNAVHKTGATWKNGEAVHLILWQHRISTPITLWLADHEPVWLSPLLTWLTLRVELLIPLLLLLPFRRDIARGLAFVLGVTLHVGIALVMSLAVFSYAMICLVFVNLPGEAWDAIRRRLPGKSWLRPARLRARLVRGISRHGLATVEKPRSPALLRVGRFSSHAVLVLLFVVQAVEVSYGNRKFPKALRIDRPEWMFLAMQYPRMRQSWSMFAPDAPTDDGTLVIDAVTAAGTHVDPFTGKPPDFERIRRETIPYSIAVGDYFLAIRAPHNARFRRELQRYLGDWHTLTGRARSARLLHAQFWWVSYDPPPRGSYEPGPIRKELLWTARL